MFLSPETLTHSFCTTASHSCLQKIFAGKVMFWHFEESSLGERIVDIAKNNP
jgi:hypothetical protein